MADALTLREHRPRLDADRLARYEADGYLSLPGILEPALVDSLRAAIDRLWDESRRLTEKTRHFDLAEGHSPERPRLRRLSSPTELDEAFFEIAFESVLGDIAADCVGGPVKFYHSKVNFKLPAGGAEIGWHQDWPVFPHTNSKMVALSVPLNASRRGNGCLKTIPGSHRWGPLSHWDGDRYALNCNAALKPEDVAGSTFNEAEPGDLLAHHGLSVHGSEANLSEEIRTTYIVQYVAADSFAYTAPVIDSRHRNWMVRGEPARYATVEAGRIELPPDFSTGYSSIYAHQEGRKAA